MSWAVTRTNIEPGTLEHVLSESFHENYGSTNGALQEQFEAAMEAVYNLRGAIEHEDRYHVSIAGHVHEGGDDPRSFITVTLGGV